jgi:cytochrome c-type biogenesis protein CcmE
LLARGYDSGVSASPARLVIALSVAAALAIFVVYTAVAGAGTPQIVPTQVHKYTGQTVTLVGTVRATRGDAGSAGGLRFVLSDPNQRVGRVPVVYHGSVPDLYHVGRVVVVAGTLRGGTFRASSGSLTTKCPDHYAPKKSPSP